MTTLILSGLILACVIYSLMAPGPVWYKTPWPHENDAEDNEDDQ